MLNKVRSFTLILLLTASLTPQLSRAENSFSQGTVPFVTDTSFSKEVSYHHGPVLVLFGAEWAAPAKEVAGYYDKVASQLEGKVKLMKFDIDANPVLPPVFKVRAVPALLLFSDGNLIARKFGALSEPELLAFVDEGVKREQHCQQ